MCDSQACPSSRRVGKLWYTRTQCWQGQAWQLLPASNQLRILGPAEIPFTNPRVQDLLKRATDRQLRGEDPRPRDSGTYQCPGACFSLFQLLMSFWFPHFIHSLTGCCYLHPTRPHTKHHTQSIVAAVWAIPRDSQPQLPEKKKSLEALNLSPNSGWHLGISCETQICQQATHSKEERILNNQKKIQNHWNT